MDVEKLVQDTFDQYHMSVVLVIRNKPIESTSDDMHGGTGSGFMIGKKDTSYLIMTNQHVISDSQNRVYELRVRISGETTEYEAVHVYSDDDSDLAIIKVDNVIRECSLLQFRDSSNAAAETVVVQLAYILSRYSLLNLYPSVCPGTIAKPFVADGSFLQNVLYSSASRSGISGSPIMLDHKVIGVVFEGLRPSSLVMARSCETVQAVMMGWLQNNETRTIDEMIEQMLQKI